MQTLEPLNGSSTADFSSTYTSTSAKNVVDHFEFIARRYATKVALVDGEVTLTYQMMNEKANQLAHYLLNCGIGKANKVSVCLQQSAQRIIAFLAVLKAGAAYVPIDGELPEARIQMMVEDAEVSLMLTQRHYGYKVKGFAQADLALDDLTFAEELAALPTDNPGIVPSLHDAAYLIYTSGSSGLPKGVLIGHQSFYHFIKAQAQVLGLGADSHTLQFASPSFDAAVIDIWVPLLQGATIHLYPNNKIVGEPLLDFITAQQIDTIPLLPPAVLGSLPTNKPIAKLHTIAIGGEACTENVIKAWHKRVKLINSYGPTEATVAITNHCFDEDSDPRIIGTPMPEAILLVLDEGLNEIAIGEAGELYIGGPQLALGYLNREEDNKKAFIEVPMHLTDRLQGYTRLYKTGDRVIKHANGKLEFAGRKDEQVKIRGYRIELAEIEHHIARLPQVARAAVKVHRPAIGLPLLVAFVQPTTVNGKVSGAFADLRGKLQQLMPLYMVPDKIIVLDQLPLTHAGKVDKAQLVLNIDEKQTPIKRKDGDLTATVKQLWKELLGVEEVKKEDDFFDLGGHSLLLAQLHVGLPETVRNRISLPELYTYTTVETFVEEVEKRMQETEVSQQLRATQTRNELLKDAELPFDFTVAEIPDASVLTHPKHIFLTGVTGFVGSHLLEELLKNTQAKIYCLVRANDKEAALQRIKATFAKFKLPWAADYYQRIVAIQGDLAVPNFGLKTQDYEQLADTIEVVYHSGSSVSYVQPYAHIKKPNIDGLQHIIRLSIDKKVKYLVLLSSMGVFSWGRPFTSKTWMYEDDPIEQNLEAVTRDLGYIKSKWVMESIAEKAKAKGLPIINFRLGFAVCHSTSGAMVMNQWWGALIRSCVQLKSFPLVMGLKDELTTVDYMCKAIVHISKKKEAVNQDFHLSPLPENDVSLTDFCAKINEYYGLDLKGMEYHEWLNQWKYNKDLPIYPLLSLFTEDVHEGKCLVEAYENTYYYDRSNTQRLLSDTDIAPPAFDERIMRPYLQFMGVIQ